MFNPERPRSEEFLNIAYKKSLKVLSQDTIDIKDFVDVYGKEEIKKDLAEIEKLENSFSKKNQKEERLQEKIVQEFGGEKELGLKDKKQFATIFEALIHYLGEQANWFGQNAFTFHSSKYDDYKNGVDEVIVFQNEDDKDKSYLGLAIDVTTGTKAGFIKKLKKEWQEVKNGTLGKIKYFNEDVKGVDQKNSYKGALEHVPKVVVGDIPEEIKEVTKLWLNKKHMELGEHPIQFCILDQIKVQLQIFKDWTKEQLDKGNDKFE